VTKQRSTAAAVLAVDGGNSKADLALVAADGTLLAAVHGPTVSHQAVGLERGMANLEALADDARRAAGLDPAMPLAPDGVYSLAGADYPEDERLLRRAIQATGLTGSTTVLNDTFGALRAGTHRPWGVVLICGQGINGAAVAPSGRSARFDGVGEYSGDWGGGGGIGDAALAAAVRGRDGRGPRTSLETRVPAHFGLASPPALTKAFYLGRIEHRRVSELAPLVFSAAGDGDAVARSIVDRLADELSGMAAALIRRLRMGRLDPEVVLAGGVFRTKDPSFYERLERGVHAAAPAARLVRLAAPPVLGAVLLGLDRLSGDGAVPPDADLRIRTALEGWDPR
jgi:N-acetylglucosamine kinase-like BadF-type ATPase